MIDEAIEEERTKKKKKKDRDREDEKQIRGCEKGKNLRDSEVWPCDYVSLRVE